MERLTAFLFAGQGAQYVGMGEDLYAAFPESKAVFDRADSALGFAISKLCFEGPQEELTQTRNCQPAILTMSIAAFKAFQSLAGCKLEDVRYVAGLSLGEYSALVAAGSMDFADAVCLVRLRGELMEEEAKRNPGRMLSLIGLDLDAVKEVCSQTNTQVANINCPGQVVISGGIKEIGEAEGLAKVRGARRAVVLDVSGAFHSSFMERVSLKLAQALDKIKINAPRIPLVSNTTAKPVSSVQEIKDNLIKQVAASVLWEDSMRFILSQGISHFVEFGPGKVLKGLMRRINEQAEVINIEKKDDIISR